MVIAGCTDGAIGKGSARPSGFTAAIPCLEVWQGQNGSRRAFCMPATRLCAVQPSNAPHRTKNSSSGGVIGKGSSCLSGFTAAESCLEVWQGRNGPRGASCMPATPSSALCRLAMAKTSCCRRHRGRNQQELDTPLRILHHRSMPRGAAGPDGRLLHILYPYLSLPLISTPVLMLTSHTSRSQT
jgi:hypothetical protein